MFNFCFLLQEVLFLEYHSPIINQRIKKALLGGTLVEVLLVIAFIVSNYQTVFYMLLIGWIIAVFVGLVIYGSYTGRKKHKWLAFLECVPMYGFFYGIDRIINIPNYYLKWIKQDIYTFFVYLILFLVLVIIKRTNQKFFRDLEKDKRNRSLSTSEEAVVWAVGIWLFLSSSMDDFLIESSSRFIANYISILNFIFVIIILMFVITSNYRDYFYKKSSMLQKSLILTMADLVENRDENTGGHIHRTSKYVEIIARKLQAEKKYPEILTESYIENMIIAAPLHDVGKIHIPDAILNKAGKLDAEEFEVMKTHTLKGREIIDKVEGNTGNMDYLNIARDMAEYHHERMDGKGYPHGIKGDEIPLCAKIMAVADVFDALSSKRCYKDAMPLEKAFAIIEEETGPHFDVEIAKAFMDCRKEIEQVVNV
ncbi:MAG: HD domain-containing protein [Acetatifactor sp.]|nr:HD domain-containing protein [Acetatifactor sp.]